VAYLADPIVSCARRSVSANKAAPFIIENREGNIPVYVLHGAVYHLPYQFFVLIRTEGIQSRPVAMSVRSVAEVAVFDIVAKVILLTNVRLGPVTGCAASSLVQGVPAQVFGPLSPVGTVAGEAIDGGR
jgi:hypothetical protein